ncbi:hypothetical protein F5Y17DRAFT_255035 [Xylariaceae sp. FL0594]|nr:hypothetical protein F5Y17DRAFT_255035 [Xylariaceae sp. FL0594]
MEGPLGFSVSFAQHQTFTAMQSGAGRCNTSRTVEREARASFFARMQTFPIHPPMSDWYHYILGLLEPDVLSYARCLIELGNGRLISGTLLDRASQPSATWGVNGEPELVQPRTSLSCWGPEFDGTLGALCELGLLDTVGSDLKINPYVAAMIEPSPSLVPRQEAFKWVCHAYPKHRSLEPVNSLEDCKLLLPYLETVLSGPGEFLSDVDAISLQQAAEACLSSLQVGDASWNERALMYLGRLIPRLRGLSKHERSLFRARYFRAQASITPWFKPSKLSTRGIRSTVLEDHRFKGEYEILIAQLQLQRVGAKPALHTLASIEGSTSTLGKEMTQRVKLLRAGILRGDGRFQEAYELLNEIGSATPAVPAMTETAFVLCELGRIDEACKHVAIRLRSAKDAVEREGYDLELVWAQVSLYRYMLDFLHGRPTPSLEVVMQAYKRCGLTQSRRNEVEEICLLVGQAIAEHIQGDLDEAKAAWMRVSDTVGRSIRPWTYVEMVVAYSLSDIAFNQFNSVRARDYRQQWGNMLVECDPDRTILGLASVLVKILHKWTGINTSEDVVMGEGHVVVVKREPAD